MKHDSSEMSDRQQAERSFWDTHAESSKGVVTTEHLLTLLLQNQWLKQGLALLGDIANKTLLDCGAGEGASSLFLTQQGAIVFPFDISGKSLQKLSDQREKGLPVFPVTASFEQLPFRDQSLDGAWGSYILHHVNIGQAAKELRRVLRPGSAAVFVETWNGNFLLNWARKHLAGRYGIARYGTLTERPLSGADVVLLQRFFQVELYFPACVIFSKACTNIFRWQQRWRTIIRILCWIDDQLSRWAFFRKRGYYCILRLQKGSV